MGGYIEEYHRRTRAGAARRYPRRQEPAVQYGADGKSLNSGQRRRWGKVRGTWSVVCPCGTVPFTSKISKRAREAFLPIDRRPASSIASASHACHSRDASPAPCAAPPSMKGGSN